jgi:hypothetical protein
LVEVIGVEVVDFLKAVVVEVVPEYGCGEGGDGGGVVGDAGLAEGDGLAAFLEEEFVTCKFLAKSTSTGR